MQWHPFAELFPYLEGEELEGMKASIKSTGGNKGNPILFRVVNGKLQGIAGRNRMRCCKELGIKPTLKRIKLADDEVAAFIIRDNITRRHMTRELRQTLVAELRAKGDSTRAIAETLGVGQRTVVRDLTASGESCDSPAEIFGKDGKIYSPTPPTPSAPAHKLCRDCRTGGAKPDCKLCLALNTPAAREPGDDTELEAAARRPMPKNKSGHLYEWKKFEEGIGILMREIVNAGRPYNAQDKPEAQALGQELMEWKRRFKEWHQSLAKKG